MTTHPFLDEGDQPKWSTLQPEYIENDISLALEEAEKNIQKIRNLNPADVTFLNTIKALEQSTSLLNSAWGLVSHLDSVCNSDDLRKAHNAMLPAVSEFGAKIPLDGKLWKNIKAFAESEQVKSLSQIDQRLVHETIKDFQEAGADLSAEKRKRLEELSGELA